MPQREHHRLVAIDNLRSFLTLLVVVHHAVLAYVSYAPLPFTGWGEEPMIWRVFPVVDGEQLEGCIDIDRIKQVPRAQWDATSVREVMAPSDPTNTVPAGMETEKLLTTMLQMGRPARFMVTEGRKLVGIIALKDVLELIALKMEIEPPQGDA